MVAMAKLTKTIDHKSDMAVFTVDGDLDHSDEMLDFIESHDNEKQVTRNLFDFRNASWSSIPVDEFKVAIQRARKFSRKGIKTAFVLPSDADYGMGRMLSALSEVSRYVSTIRVFRTIEAATEWLFSQEN
tara:strand:- start:4062 stop:4451 length:390 start_codon:yes stop_codon:yes gene_type:complete